MHRDRIGHVAIVAAEVGRVDQRLPARCELREERIGAEPELRAPETTAAVVQRGLERILEREGPVRRADDVGGFGGIDGHVIGPVAPTATEIGRVREAAPAAPIFVMNASWQGLKIAKQVGVPSSSDWKGLTSGKFCDWVDADDVGVAVGIERDRIGHVVSLRRPGRSTRRARRRREASGEAIARAPEERLSGQRHRQVDRVRRSGDDGAAVGCDREPAAVRPSWRSPIPSEPLPPKYVARRIVAPSGESTSQNASVPAARGPPIPGKSIESVAPATCTLPNPSIATALA